ncbi:flavin reductase family protein [Aquibacillus rhizosphaerae]|uniref:Flavin reductase family protein n=1 Tax=Aquibacillus rhizosphaerae TaxID=3051431 RepID=A0ABT7L905_9BACI|nr:flavin reductase family protein [Aquibacillus sp. LR5S19]MDL4841060.1 flavin reductase family protein [Aquibacillus sp. LR5S19]
MIIKKDQFNNHNMSKLIKGVVVPRPIAWVSSIDKTGIHNIAPFSFYTVASLDPITLCFSVGSGDVNNTKDTLANIKETNEFVVNVVTESLANQMYETSKFYQSEIDEFDVAKLNTAKSEYVKAPRLKESPIAMECKLDRIINVGTSHLILGEVVCYHIDNDVYSENDKVDPDKLNIIGRMAGDYAHINDYFKLPR